MFKKKRFKPGNAYAVTTGKYLGEFLVYVETKDKDIYFLSLPKMINRKISKEDVQLAVTQGIIEYQESLPGHVKSVCLEQYKKNEKAIH
ncbi:MAG: hypothetical protein CMM25_01920 [Rhodospirillaceae bacterium]|nr:hypothetical protein [Rhodospirillaceae bacterium]